MAIMFVSPLRHPISYALFQHPEPREWLLPNGFEYCAPGPTIGRIVIFNKKPNASFRSLPITGYLDFLCFWFFIMIAGGSYCLVAFRSVMYFLGVCVYVSGMVEDLSTSLDDLDKRIRDRPIEQTGRMNSQQALTRAIRFHTDIIEYTFALISPQKLASMLSDFGFRVSSLPKLAHFGRKTIKFRVLSSTICCPILSD